MYLLGYLLLLCTADCVECSSGLSTHSQTPTATRKKESCQLTFMTAITILESPACTATELTVVVENSTSGLPGLDMVL